MVLGLKKRFEDYESLGELFRHSKELILEKTMVDKIWEIIIELYVMVFSELGVDFELFVLKIIEKQESINKLMKNTLDLLSISNNKTA
jgi:hypothetical protein